MMNLNHWLRQRTISKLQGVKREIEEINRQVNLQNLMSYEQKMRLTSLARKKGELEAKIDEKPIKEKQ